MSVPAPPSSPTPPPTSQQVVDLVGPLRSSMGTHQISLRLAPEGLGTVDATVLVRSGHVVVELSADSPAARQALSAALPDLRNQLSSGGQQASVFMSDANGGQGRGSGAYLTSASNSSTGSAADDADGEPALAHIGSVTGGSHSSKSIDLRL